MTEREVISNCFPGWLWNALQGGKLDSDFVSSGASAPLRFYCRQCAFDMLVGNKQSEVNKATRRLSVFSASPNERNRRSSRRIALAMFVMVCVL